MNFFIGAFHDAVLLYGMALNETLDTGKNIMDGYNITRVMWNRTFNGMSLNVMFLTILISNFNYKKHSTTSITINIRL